MTKTEAEKIVRWLTMQSPTIEDYSKTYSFDEINKAVELVCGQPVMEVDPSLFEKGQTKMPSGQQLTTGGVKHDKSKRRLDLVPPSLTNAVARILEFGAEKYGDNNWRQGLQWSRIYAALQRHLSDFWSGQDTDLESKLPHLYHAACNIAFLIEFYEQRKDLDDRYKAPVVESAWEKDVRRMKDSGLS